MTAGTKPLVTYYGGKQRLAKRIAALLPPHSVYAEPFAGGAAVFFMKGRPLAGNYIEALNDSDRRLYIMYQQAKLHPVELMRLLKSTPYSAEIYRKTSDVLSNMNSRDELGIAWATIVNISMSFNGKLNGGWRRSTFTNHSSAWHNYRLRIEKTLARLDRVYLDCVDALDFIDKWDTPSTVFYCDPPYPGVHQGHYSGYTQADFDALIVKLINCKASFVLSCYDNDSVLDHWQRYEFNVTTSAVKSVGGIVEDADRTEVLWVVDRSANAPLAVKLWRMTG